MLAITFLIGIILFIIAYKIYGDILIKKFKLNNNNKTPSCTMQDNIDYCPTKTPILFGHHFSSIAGAAPIIGPIMAGIMFGWLPALIWIVLGSIFIGGVHDFSSLIASIRHKAKSIAEITKQYIGKNAYIIFLLFIWLTLVYILIVFLDLTAATFATNGIVASNSIMYIILAVLFGICIYKFKIKLHISTIIFIGLMVGSILLAHQYPVKLPGFLFHSPKKSWSMLLLIYAFFASTLPVWILLQPRDYLSSFLLYSSVIIGAIGILFGGYTVNYPAFTSFVVNNKPLFPILFVTIACGAISGFHSLVASGTTSKQLYKETDARPIGYGGMLMEGVVALIALCTVIMIAKGSPETKVSGLTIFANGIGKFASVIGIAPKYGQTFGLLVLSAFLLTTLDTATRLARYILQELLNWNFARTRFIATGFTIILPLIFVLIDIKDAQGNIIPAWKAIWPIFGTTNQLLAALTLLVISAWLIKTGKKAYFTIIPMIFMMIVTITSIVQLIFIYKFTVVGIIAITLLLLAIYLIISSIKTFVKLGSGRGI